MLIKPLKITGGVVRQFQAGDVIDPKVVPAVVAAGKLVTIRVNDHVAANTDTVVTVIPSVGYVDLPATDSAQPGAGKSWILAGMSATTRTNDKDPFGCIFRLRCSSTGTVTTASSQVGIIGTGAQTDNQDIVNSASTPLLNSAVAIVVSGTQALGLSSEGAGGNHSFMLWGFEVED